MSAPAAILSKNDPFPIPEHSISHKRKKPDSTPESSCAASSQLQVCRPRPQEKLQKTELTASSKIQYIFNYSVWFPTAPDVGMDRYLITNGALIGTGGVGPCFVLCMIGKTVSDTPVLGLCHTSNIVPFKDIHAHIMHEMAVQQKAVKSTIETYVIGGQGPSKTEPEGTLEEEKMILALARSEKIKGILFNLTSADNEDESLDIVLTTNKIFVSKKSMIPVSGKEDGLDLFKHLSKKIM